MRSRQLTFVFADSPQGGKEAVPTDVSAGNAHLLRITKDMPTTDLIAPAADTSHLFGPWFKEFSLNDEIPTQGAGCVDHKSGSVRGPGEQSPGPTRPNRVNESRSADGVVGEGVLEFRRSPASARESGNSNLAVSALCLYGFDL